MNFINIAEKLINRSQFNKSDVDSSIKKYVIKYSEESDKQYRKFDYDKALYSILDDLPNDELKIHDKLKHELEYLGYIQTTFPNLSPEYVFVKEYECKFKNPKLTLHRLCNGDTDIVKVKRNLYDNNPINVGDIIKTVECSNEGRWFNDGKDEDGKDIWRQDKNDKETILKKWTFVR